MARGSRANYGNGSEMRRVELRLSATEAGKLASLAREGETLQDAIRRLIVGDSPSSQDGGVARVIRERSDGGATCL